MPANTAAYLATGQMIALMEGLSRIKVSLHDQENIPDGSTIFVVNHFTRLETLLLPYHIFKLTQTPVWSLASHTFFEGPLGTFLESMGTVSTRDPDRDRLVVKSLLTGEANWIIFPEGQMVKNKETLSRTGLFGLFATVRPAHTGAANLALRTEFYRQRLRHMLSENPAEAKRLLKLFQIEDVTPVLDRETWIVPVNITYYPLRARENMFTALADRFTRSMPVRLREELMTEGTMLFEGVDIDIRFGKAFAAREVLDSTPIRQDMLSNRQINFDDHLPSRSTFVRKSKGLMQQLMSNIYSMTTVNHDHLFVSLLRAMPFKSVAEDDFRRRAFLLADLVPDSAQLYCHHSLETGQTALLTDDRFHKYRYFLELAENTAVIQRSNGILTKDRSKFSPQGDFQRIRIDNPLGVIENEVLPLASLQRHILEIAWLPEIMVRHRVSRILLRQSEKDFEDDYCHYCRPGESKERHIGAPYLLKGRSRQVGVVLVHGFLAAPREMLELATYLNNKGFWVYCIRLKGHGTSPDDLATRSGSDWLESVDLGYALMHARCRRVVVGGFSFGAGLALDCAARISDLAGVFAVCPPFRLQDISSRFAPAVTTWNNLMDALHIQGGKKEFVEIVPERPQINYTRLPVAALREMEYFMKTLEPRLAAIQTPALVVQAQGDPVVAASGTKRLFEHIGSKHKRYQSFDLSRHGILAGEGSLAVHTLIADFISSLPL